MGYLRGSLERSADHVGCQSGQFCYKCGWASLLILTGTFEQLVIYSGFVLTGFSALTVGAVLVLRWRQPTLHRPFRVPLYPLLPGLFIMISLVIVGESLIHRPLEAGLGVMTVFMGLPFYWFWRRTAGNVT